MKKGVALILQVVLVWGLLFTTPVQANPEQEIVEAQKSLKKLRYYNARIDGIIGPKTQKAILQYQYEMDLPITGAVDDATLGFLKRPSIILNTQNFAPFHYPAGRKGEADGPIPQIVRRSCSKAGMNCRILLYDQWRQAQEDVKKGKADGMFVIAWNSKRAKWLHRSTAIVETEYGLFVRNDNPLKFNQAVQQPSILEGYTIGVYGPSGTSSSLLKLKSAFESRDVNFNFEMEDDDRPLFEKLSHSKNNYAVYSNRIVGESIVRGLGLTNTRYAGKHRRLSYYVGFSKQQVPPDLVEKFNAAYLGLVAQGDVISIMANHSMPIPKGLGGTPGKGIDKGNIEQASTGRFHPRELNGMPVVVDSKTCLMWQQSGTTQHCNWMEALAFVEKLNRKNYAGFSDWRLPNIDELKSLLEKDRQQKNGLYIQPIFDALQQTCWSADKRKVDVQFIDFHEGAWGSKNQGDTNFVRAVRAAACKKS